MFYCGVAVIAFILLQTLHGCNGSKIISSPKHLYVLEGSFGTIRCQNISNDGETFYSYIRNAIWYRYYNNGTNITIGSAGAVSTLKHTLNFNPLLNEDQGLYFCCASDGQCSNMMSSATISTPPRITAIGNHTAEVGSTVTIMCRILNQGVPLAQFRWIRDGTEINGDNSETNHSNMILTLLNVTVDDAGVYTCSATSERSYRSDHIILTVLKNSEYISNGSNDINHNGTSSGEVYLIVTFFESSCHGIKDNLSAILSRLLKENYDKNFTITVKQTECLNRSTASLKLNITGHGANETLQQIFSDINSTTLGLNIQFGIGGIHFCKQKCTGPTIASNPTSNHDDVNDRKNKFSQLILIVLLGAIILFSILLIICSMIVVYSRCRKLHKAKVLSMQFNDEPYDAKNQAYNTLQFHGHDHVGLPSSHQPEANYHEISSGYVEHSINSNIITCFSKNQQVVNEESTKQKPVVVSTSNGTGIIRVGDLQAIIPSNHTPDDLNNLKIVPSSTHESYVDVLKQFDND